MNFADGQRRTCRLQIFSLPSANETFAIGKCLAGRRQISYRINGKFLVCHREICSFAMQPQICGCVRMQVFGVCSKHTPKTQRQAPVLERRAWGVYKRKKRRVQAHMPISRLRVRGLLYTVTMNSSMDKSILFAAALFCAALANGALALLLRFSSAPHHTGVNRTPARRSAGMLFSACAALHIVGAAGCVLTPQFLSIIQTAACIVLGASAVLLVFFILRAAAE